MIICLLNWEQNAKNSIQGGEHGLTCSGLAKRSGLDPTTFNKSKRASVFGQPRWPSTSSIAKIITATHSTPQDFFKFITSEDCGEHKEK